MTLLSEVHALREENAEIMRACNETGALVKNHEEQINGKRGIQHALDENTAAIAALRRAAYWVAGVIIVASVGFGFTVLRVVAESSP